VRSSFGWQLVLVVFLASPSAPATENKEAARLLDDGFHSIQSARWAEAIDSLERAEKLDPADWNIESNLAFALNQQGHKQEAFQHYASAYQIDPSKVTSVMGLAGCYASFKDFKPAVDVCRRYIRSYGTMTEEDFPVFKMLGFLYANEKQPRLAYENHQKALALHPTDEEAWACAVDDLEFAGGTVEAATVFKEFLKRFPQSLRRQNFKERLRRLNFQLERQKVQENALNKERADIRHSSLDEFIIFPDNCRTAVRESSIAMVKQGLRSLPQLFVDQLRGAGYKVMIAPHLTDVLPKIAEDHPRGWAKLATWHNANGTVSYDHKWIVIGERFKNIFTGKEITDPQMDRTIAHEFGHAYDFFLGNSTGPRTDIDSEQYTQFSHSQSFARAYQADAQRIKDKGVKEKLEYFLQPGDAGSEELFAQLFPCFYCGTPEPNSPEELFSRFFPTVLATMKEAFGSDLEYIKLYGRKVKNYR
jgi:tetratricopeptide (TPR) repeat protein